MRIFGFIVLALFLAAGPAAAWEEYKYPDQGVAIQFPAQPQAMKSTYKSVYAKALPSMVYSAELDHVIYRLTVIDLAGNVEKGSGFVNEAGYELMRQGKVITTDFPRVYADEKSIFGVTLLVDRKDGSRALSSIYYHMGWLYIPEGIVLPARGDRDMTSPSRYVQTIRFPPDSFD